MDNTELHYIAYDPDEIWTEIITNYVEAGGDILYPGDEKEILLRGVQANVVQIYAALDNALRMKTLRYAVGEYLDVYGETRNCSRIEATTASATVTISASDSGTSKTLAAGTTLTADGSFFYKLSEDVTLSGVAEEIDAKIEAVEAGEAGNGLLAGMLLELVKPVSGVETITAKTNATGGGDSEDDETYRERIRTYGLTSVSAGPQTQYEAVAKAVTTDVIDARAVNEGAGEVGVYLIIDEDADASAVIASVTEAINATDVRPLTDHVTVSASEIVEYVLNVEYRSDNSSNITSAINAAVTEYQSWQDNTIGRAFNPGRLEAMLYQAGATRVTWGDGSAFSGTGAVEYTEIGESVRCKGVITLTRVTS